MGGQPNHVAHRQQGAAAGEPSTGLGLQFAQGGGDDDGGRQPVVLTQITGGQQGTPGGVERVVVALSGAAGVSVDRFLRRLAIHDGLLVDRIAHAGSGQFREDGIQGGASFRGQIPADRAHAVEALVTDGDAPSAGTVVIGEIAVGVEAVGEFVGEPAELVRAMLAAQPGKLRLGLLASFDVDEVRQSVHEAANNRHVGRPDASGPLRLGGGGQQWRQCVAGDRFALAEIGGVVNAPRCFRAGDPQPVRQGRRQLAAQLRRVGLLADLVDQRMLDSG